MGVSNAKLAVATEGVNATPVQSLEVLAQPRMAAATAERLLPAAVAWSSVLGQTELARRARWLRSRTRSIGA